MATFFGFKVVHMGCQDVFTSLNNVPKFMQTQSWPQIMNCYRNYHVLKRAATAPRYLLRDFTQHRHELFVIALQQKISTSSVLGYSNITVPMTTISSECLLTEKSFCYPLTGGRNLKCKSSFSAFSNKVLTVSAAGIATEASSEGAAVIVEGTKEAGISSVLPDNAGPSMTDINSVSPNHDLNSQISPVQDVGEAVQTVGEPSFSGLGSEASITYTSNLPADYIPSPPAIPIEEITEAIETVGDPSLASLGLAGWSPSGIVQQCLEWMHVGCGIPWWCSILIGTLTLRLCLFPIVIKSQRNLAKLHNNMPQMQLIQMRMTEARNCGNKMEAARYAHEMMAFLKEKKISYFQSTVMPLVQAPIFISVFFGLRGMTNAPVESMKTGGLLWFPDLTVCDPYYVLPVITSATLFVTVQLGIDAAQLNVNQMQFMTYVMRALPLIIFPFIINFPAAIAWYWTGTNLISLAQVALLRVPAVRTYFDIEEKAVIHPDNLPMKKKGFVEECKSSWTNMKITREIHDRERYDEMNFKRAGTGPLVKTYKYDPTKQRQPERKVIAAKKKTEY